MAILSNYGVMKFFFPRNITYIPVVKIFSFLVLEQNILFVDRNYLDPELAGC